MSHHDPPAPARPREGVIADNIRTGDVLLITGIEATVTAIDHGTHHIDGQLVQNAVAIDWRGGSARGVLFRRLDELVCRITEPHQQPRREPRDA